MMEESKASFPSPPSIDVTIDEYRSVAECRDCLHYRGGKCDVMPSAVVVSPAAKYPANCQSFLPRPESVKDLLERLGRLKATEKVGEMEATTEEAKTGGGNSGGIEEAKAESRVIPPPEREVEIPQAAAGESEVTARLTEKGLILERGGRRVELGNINGESIAFAAAQLGVEPKHVWMALLGIRDWASRALRGTGILPLEIQDIWHTLTFEEKMYMLSTVEGGVGLSAIAERARLKGWLDGGKDVSRLRVGEKGQLIWEVIWESNLFDFVKVRWGDNYEVYVADRNLLYPAEDPLDILSIYVGGHLATKQVANEVKRWALKQAKPIMPEQVNIPKFLATRKGIINLETFEYTSFADAYYTRAAPASVSEEFLRRLARGEIDESYFSNHLLVNAIRRFYDDENWNRLLDVLGAILAPHSLRLLAFIVGPENTGKTTLSEGIKSALGSMCAPVNLQEFEQDNFAKEKLLGARVNISVEEPDIPIRHTNLLKQLVGGDTISVNRKFKPRVDLENNTLKLIVLANKLPKLEKFDSALLDRVVVIFTDNPLDDSEKDETILSKIREERSRNLEFLLWCAWRLSRKNWKIARQDKEMLAQLLEKARYPLSDWEEARCVIDPRLRLEREKGYADYVDYARTGGTPVERILSRREYYAVMRTKYPEVKIRGKWYFVGIGLKSEVEGRDSNLYEMGKFE